MTGVPQPLPLVILISGRGSNMVAIARAVAAGRSPARVAAVISDRGDAHGLERARELGIPTAVVAAKPGQPRSDYDRSLAAAVREHSPGLVPLAGFMRILGADFVHEFSGRLLNIHPSLLPKYTGLHTHARVLAAREHEHGCSVHFVTEELDGGPIVIQARVPVLPGDDAERLAARVQVQEHRIYPMAIEWFANGRLQWRNGSPWLDGRVLAQPVVLAAEPA
jgi:phosphoribosylglycinamide formyltransferase-1